MDLNKLKEMYGKGMPLSLIAEEFKVTEEEVLKQLRDIKKQSVYGRTYSDNLKQLISKRDAAGVSRRTISFELEVGMATVKRSCEQFGNAFKDASKSDKRYTIIAGKHDFDKCPLCKSQKVNVVEERTTYCKSCNNEFVHKPDHVLKVNWEYVD